jgi:hypothetical protein
VAWPNKKKVVQIIHKQDVYWKEGTNKEAKVKEGCTTR